MLMDRYGNFEKIDHLLPATFAPVANLDPYMRKKSITDAYNRTVTFTTARQGGSFVITSAGLTNGDTITYTYSDRVMVLSVIFSMSHMRYQQNDVRQYSCRVED